MENGIDISQNVAVFLLERLSHITAVDDGNSIDSANGYPGQSSPAIPAATQPNTSSTVAT
jgi:hypothetical protein